MEARISYAQGADDASIAYAVLGEPAPGTPRIVVSAGLVLGCFQLQFNWSGPTRFLRELSQRAEVLIFDPIGMGLSSGRPPPWDPDAPNEIDVVADAAGWDHYGVFAAFVAAPPAIAHAARQPDRVTDLMLWCAVSSMQPLRASPRGAALMELEERDRDLFMRTFAHAFAGWADPDALQIAELHLRAERDRASIDTAHPDVSADEVIGDVRARTLVVHRRELELISLDHARSITARIPGAQLAIVEGGGILPYDAAGTTVEVILDFFQQPAATPVLIGHEQSAITVDSARELGLTARQAEVLRLLANGESNQEIGLALGISVHTVDRHVSALYRRIGARGRADATAFALRNALA